MKQAIVKGVLATVLAVTLLAGCSGTSTPSVTATPTVSIGPVLSSSPIADAAQAETTPIVISDSAVSDTTSVSPTPIQGELIVYENTQYGFKFTLPGSWTGYQIVNEEWKGASSDSKDEETGPMISIRHPKWTAENPRQDIPILVFTTEQWDALQQDKFHIGAAPIGPSELGHNSKYVFALPARYNFAYPTGFEEVETILNAKPLQSTEK